MDTEGEHLDLTGVWLGSFSYPTPARQPVTFTAVLDESGGWVSGSTEEAGQVGAAAGQTLTATLQGVRAGRRVSFLKTYDAEFRGYDAVQYAGDLSGDGAEIDGRWSIHGNWSGQFVMVRSGHPYAAVRQEVAEKV